MKFILLSLSAVFLLSCSSTGVLRGIASEDRPDISGTYLGVAKYSKKWCKKKICPETERKKAVRIYLTKDSSGDGTYNAVYLEYVNLLKMFPQYAAARSIPSINKVIGYLKHITKKISAHKVVPVEGSPHRYEILDLRVKSGSLKAYGHQNPRYLELAEGANSMEGARIFGFGSDVYFPEKGERKTGIQLAIANLVYGKIGLNSTWRDRFLPGPYLAAYGKLDDVVLNLAQDGGVMTGEFTESEVGKAETKKKGFAKRRKVFTNPKSAGLVGDYLVTEPIDGMFVFKKANEKASGELDHRIGLFIDVFDATEKLGQDVVEIAFIDPENPEDFLMYYEHPENGEGK